MAGTYCQLSQHMCGPPMYPAEGTKRFCALGVSPLTMSQDTTPGSWRPRCSGAIGTFQAVSCGHLQDLVIPNLKHPAELAAHSPLLGRAERERGILLLFRGDVGQQRHSHYSRGIRQKLYSLVWSLLPAVAPGELSTTMAAHPLPRCHHSAGVRSQVYEAGYAVTPDVHRPSRLRSGTGEASTKY